MTALFTAVAILAGPPALSEIVFVRHGETVANATGRYNSRTINAFSKKGMNQVQKVTDYLAKAGSFDAILVSPSERALRTVAPYLMRSKQTALVWPELYECCTGRDKSQSKPGKFSWGGTFSLPSDIKGAFQIDPAHNRLPVSPKFADGVAQVKSGLLRLSRTYNPRASRILIVAHSGSGGVLMEMLEGKSRFGRKHPENAKPYVYRKIDGKWQLARN